MMKRSILVILILIIGVIPNQITEVGSRNVICGYVNESPWFGCCYGCWKLETCDGEIIGFSDEPPDSYKGHLMAFVDPVWGEACGTCPFPPFDTACGWVITGWESAYVIDSCADCGEPSCEEWLFIECNVGGYKLYIDGEYILTGDDNGECSIKLEAGTYSVQLKKEGCNTVSETARIECGHSTTLRATMGCEEDCDNGRDDDGDGKVDCNDSDCRNNPDCDPCRNVECENRCFGCDYWKMDCEDGECVRDYIIEENSCKCGSECCPPPTTPPPTTPPEIPEDAVMLRLAYKYAPTLWFCNIEYFKLVTADFFVRSSYPDADGNIRLKEEGFYGSLKLQDEYDDIEHPVYAHIAEEVFEGNKYLVIQYWFHYLYNRYDRAPIPFDHEGDWEMIEVILEYDESILEGTSFPEPYMVAFSRHKRAVGGLIEGGEAHRWRNGIVETDENYHPVVLVAWGTHASYFKKPGIAHYDFACRDNLLRYTDLNLILLDDQSWLRFGGKWGKDDDSPNGPMIQHTKWDFPVTWAMGFLDSTEFYLGSPAHMLITDKSGNVIGFLGEEFVNEIPDAYALITDEHEYYHLPLGDYSVVITAFDEGKINFDIIVNDNGEATYISYKDRSVAHSTKAYSDMTSTEKYELRIDKDGDGSIDEIIAPDEVTEFKDKKELYSYLPHIFFFLAIIFVAVMIYRTRMGGIEKQAKFEEELSRKLQTKVMNGTLTQEEYEQKLKDIGLGRKAVPAEESGGILTNHTSELARKLDEKIEKEEIGKEEYFQLMENLGLIPTEEISKRLLNKYESGEIDKKEYLRKKKDLEEAR